MNNVLSGKVALITGGLAGLALRPRSHLPTGR